MAQDPGQVITEDTLLGWVTPAEAIELWPNAPEDDVAGFPLLAGILSTAHEVLAVKARPYLVIPERYKQAQILYSQHLWSRRRSGDGDQAMGADGLAVSTYPLVMEAYSLMAVGRSPLAGVR